MHTTRRKLALGCILAAAMILPALAQSQSGDVWYAWSPKPDKLPPYGRNKPVTRLPAVLAKHKGQARWSEQVILTKRYDTKWIQDAPGDKSATMYWGDVIVQVPQRTRFSMETVGDQPSLRFEVTHTGILPLYTGEQPKPADPPGTHYMKISTPTQPEGYDEINRPYRDFFKDVVAADPTHGPKDHLVVGDEANMANIIRGQGVPTPPPTNRGHFHIGDDEFWFILEGKCDYLIEDAGLLTADAGDVVFVPPGRFHRASWANGQMDTRLSFNVSPNLFHNFAADAGGKQ